MNYKFSKYVFACALLLMSAFIANSQLTKGDMFIGTNFNFSIGKNQETTNSDVNWETKSTSFSIDLTYSAMLSKKFDLIAGLGYNFVNQDANDPGNPQTTDFFPQIPVHAGLRYLFEINDKFYISIDLLGNYVYSRARTQNNGGGSGTNFITTVSESNYTVVQLGPGITYLISKRWSARAHLGVIYYSNITAKSTVSNGADYTTGSKSEGFSILHQGFVPGFSFFYNFRKGKN